MAGLLASMAASSGPIGEASVAFLGGGLVCRPWGLHPLGSWRRRGGGTTEPARTVTDPRAWAIVGTARQGLRHWCLGSWGFYYPLSSSPSSFPLAQVGPWWS